jgi:hypothetical protein
MKKLIILSFLISIVACSGDSDDSSLAIQDQIEDNVQSSTWRITKYIDSGDDETTHYTGYNFEFKVNNVLTASNGVNTYEGTWSVTSSNSNDDSQDDLDFNVFFSAPPDFEELSDDWDIITQTSQKIELIDVSGGNGGTDYLTFEKN